MSDENYHSSKVLPWSGQQEDWPMWSTKFMIRGTAKGYGLIMKGVVKAPAFDEDINKMVENLNEYRKTLKGNFEDKVKRMNEITASLKNKAIVQ